MNRLHLRFDTVETAVVQQIPPFQANRHAASYRKPTGLYQAQGQICRERPKSAPRALRDKNGNIDIVTPLGVGLTLIAGLLNPRCEVIEKLPHVV